LLARFARGCAFATRHFTDWVGRMWRFFLAGLVSICGVILLFMASMGDPQSGFDRSRALLRAPHQDDTSAEHPDNTSAQQTQADAATQPPDDALRQQVQSLQSRLAQTMQDMVALRSEADAEKRAADALRQQHDADQAELIQLSSGSSTSPPGTRQPVAPAAYSQTHSATSADTPSPSSNVLQGNLPKPPPTLTQGQPKQVASDFSAAQAVLDRLRRDTGTAPPEQNLQSAPPAKSAQERLSGARMALVVGRIDDARRLLEQAQVQLAFHPPEGGAIPSTGSVAAGDVAEALSMLNAGDIQDALQYIDLAMGQRGGPVQTMSDAERRG
jgi:hypothetical protein